MVLDFDYLWNTYKLQIKGVIHIGAHYGEEYKTYKKYGIKNMLFFEPLPQNFAHLKANVKGECVQKALGNETKKVQMWVEVANKGQSCSILKPELHLKQYPHITFPVKMEVDMIRLDDYPTENKYNFINMDVQGYELEVLKGSIKTLNDIDYIMTEVNRAEVYKDCAKVDQLDEFLSKFNFKRVETNWIGQTWGDAFYVKIKTI